MPFSLVALPNEILLEIIHTIANADLDNFTSTCKILRSLAANALGKHQERKRAYSKITYGDPADHYSVTTWAHPTLMLRDLLDNDLFCYPKKLFINGPVNYAHWHHVGDVSGHLENPEALARLSEVVKPLIRSFHYLDSDEDLRRGILQGDKGATIGLLLHLLQNLTALMITVNDENSQRPGNLKQVLDGLLSNINRSNTVANVASDRPLSKLSQVNFTHDPHGISRSLSMWAPLFYLPSLRSVGAYSVRAKEDTWNYSGFRSDIEKLKFINSDIDNQSFDTYLKDIKDLQHFRFHHNRRSDRISLQLFVQKLAMYASHSLRSLDIRGSSITDHPARSGDFFIGSLKEFQKLTTICLESSMFIEPVDAKKDPVSNAYDAGEGRPCRLIDMLPKSAVVVRCYSRDGELVSDLAVAMLQDLPERRAELLPNLKRIAFLCGDGLGHMKGSVLAKACREIGVKLEDQKRALN
ncbi:MAG: hypothetical protein LQ349_006374 [Xanthoria aureola]|nr:MAG: hypothetical protein LQ349_006374 [Xanthoria aureola]